MKYTTMVNKEYKEFRNMDPFSVHDKDAKYHYSEGFSDGMFQAFVALKNSGLLSGEQVLEIIQTIDSEGVSAAYEVLSEIYAEGELS